MTRNRLLYVALIAVVIVLGLTTRKYGTAFLAPWCAKGISDALWALCVYLFFAFFRPSASFRALALGALLFAFAIEFSELYQAHWLNELRGYRLLGLILGFHFHWVNFLSYTIGIGLGVLGEWWWFFRRTDILIRTDEEVQS